MGYVPYEGHLSATGFPIGNLGKKYKVHLPKKYSNKPVEVRLSSGAEFLVVVCGSIMTMPGLPRVPAADNIKLNKKGEIEGLF